jgi:hypothetical protein
MTTDKSKLEIEKLRLEIENLKRDKWLLFFNIPSILTVLASVFSILYGYNAGFFDKEKKLLEIKKEQLILDIQKFEIRKDSIKTQERDLQKQIKLIQKKYSLLSKKYFTQKKQIDSGIKEIDILISNGNLQEATIRLQDLVDEMKGIRKDFNNEFSSDFK